MASNPWSKGFVVTSFVLGSAAGSLTMGWLADRRGRRVVLQLGALLFCVRPAGPPRDQGSHDRKGLHNIL